MSFEHPLNTPAPAPEHAETTFEAARSPADAIIQSDPLGVPAGTPRRRPSA
jgi:hypothetical protein